MYYELEGVIANTKWPKITWDEACITTRGVLDLMERSDPYYLEISFFVFRGRNLIATGHVLVEEKKEEEEGDDGGGEDVEAVGGDRAARLGGGGAGGVAQLNGTGEGLFNDDEQGIGDGCVLEQRESVDWSLEGSSLVKPMMMMGRNGTNLTEIEKG